MTLVSRDSLVLFNQAFKEKHKEILLRLYKERRGDRANVSASWNSYVRGLGGFVIRGKGVTTRTVRKALNGKVKSSSVKRDADPNAIFKELLDLVNFKNDHVSGKVMVPNPDRLGQWLLIPSDVVERALVLGLP